MNNQPQMSYPQWKVRAALRQMGATFTLNAGGREVVQYQGRSATWPNPQCDPLDAPALSTLEQRLGISHSAFMANYPYP